MIQAQTTMEHLSPELAQMFLRVDGKDSSGFRSAGGSDELSRLGDRGDGDRGLFG